jgi:hypothetical protein
MLLNASWSSICQPSGVVLGAEGPNLHKHCVHDEHRMVETKQMVCIAGTVAVSKSSAEHVGVSSMLKAPTAWGFSAICSALYTHMWLITHLLAHSCNAAAAAGVFLATTMPVFQAEVQPPGTIWHLGAVVFLSATARADRQSVLTIKSAVGNICSSSAGCCSHAVSVSESTMVRHW